MNKLKDEESERKSDEDEISLSEELLLSNTNRSGESSKCNEKKKRKFKPAKFIQKHLKIKKDNNKSSENLNNKNDEKASVSSPKLGSLKRNLVKRFSRGKNDKVNPIQSNYVVDEKQKSLNNEKDFKEIVKMSMSDPNISNSNSVEQMARNKITEDTIELSKSMQTVDKSSSVISKKETSTFSSENKKVQLKITISGKKIEKVNTSASEIQAVSTKTTASENDIDKASHKSRTDIILPSTSTTVRVSTSRDEFFNVMVPRSNSNDANLHVQQQQTEAKSISNNTISSQSVASSTIVKSKDNSASTSEKEIEKYLVLTSSLNSIISAAKELDLNTDSQLLKFPENLTELKIHEEPIVNKIEKEEEKKLSEVAVKKSNLDSETELIESEDMKKSKIPVNNRKSSDISVEKDQTQSTVRTQEAHQPYHVNLTTSASTEELITVAATSPELSAESIKFELGTLVRPPKILSAAVTNNNMTPLVINEAETGVSHLESVDADEVFHSPISDSNAPIKRRDSKTRRKIAYIPQLTIYTPEEQELLKSNIIANSESFDTPSLPPDSSIFPTFDDNISVNMTPSTPEKRECLYKILVIGELGTGKTSFIKRYVHQFFSQNYRATIGVDFALKVLSWDESTIIRLQLWDIAGQERFGNMTRVYYKEAVGAFIVFDVTRTATFEAVSKWKQDLDSKVQLPDGSPIPCILLANKCDQTKQGLVTMPAKMDEYCRQNGFAGWFETSAKENTNIDESAKALVSKILQNDKFFQTDVFDGDRLMLGGETGDDLEKSKKSCSC